MTRMHAQPQCFVERNEWVSVKWTVVCYGLVQDRKEEQKKREIIQRPGETHKAKEKAIAREKNVRDRRASLQECQSNNALHMRMCQVHMYFVSAQSFKNIFALRSV